MPKIETSTLVLLAVLVVAAFLLKKKQQGVAPGEALTSFLPEGIAAHVPGSVAHAVKHADVVGGDVSSLSYAEKARAAGF